MANGWGFQSEDGTRASDVELLEAVLRFIAERNGIQLGAKPAVAPEESAPLPLPENFDAQRDALDAIAVARWRDDL